MMDLIVDKAHDSIGAGIEYIYSYGPLAEKTVILGKKINDSSSYE